MGVLHHGVAFRIAGSGILDAMLVDVVDTDAFFRPIWLLR